MDNFHNFMGCVFIGMVVGSAIGIVLGASLGIIALFMGKL